MSIQIGIARRAAFAAAIGLGLVSCTNAPKQQTSDTPIPAAPESRPVVETAAPVEEPTPVAASAPAADFSLAIYSTADPALFNPKESLIFQGAINPFQGAMSSPAPFPETMAPGYGIVREVHRFKLDAGTNHIDFSGAPRGIDPTTVSFQSLTAPKTTALLEQNLTLAKTGSVAKPTLNWTINTDKAGEHQVQLAYQTDGLSWRADYNVVMSADEKSADVSAWLTILNVSGMAYPDARLKLVDGDVDRLATRYGGGGIGDVSLSGPERNTIVREKGFSDFHVYTIAKPTSLPDNSTKQIELLPATAGVPLSRNYIFHASPQEYRKTVIGEPIADQSFGTQDKPAIDIDAAFHNGQAEHFGVALPAGRVRLYRINPTDGSREFLGEDVIAHTSKDEEVLLRLATAPDLIGDRRQTEFKEGDKSLLESFEIKLRNHKAEPVHILVRENLYRWNNWEIVLSSDKWERKDRRTIQIPVDVPANGEKVVTYSVKYSW